MSATVDYAQYQGKKVILVRNEKGKTDSEEIEGTVEATNAMGVLIKPKGKSQLTLIVVEEIEQISFVDTKPKDLVAKKLKPVEFGQARNHLLERHGITLAQVNDLTEIEAFEIHAKLDHGDSDLGHLHEDKSETPLAVAVEAEAEAITV